MDPEWENSLRQRLNAKPKILKESAGRRTCSIHRVPKCFRQGDEKAYIPQYVSVGPFHRGEPMLQAMEEHKWRYLNGVLSRAGDDGLERYFLGVREIEQSARECYAETIDLDSNTFVEMLILDGCFIIELLCMENEPSKVEEDEPIFKQGWLMSKLRNDLLMLENQIPFFVLQHLYDQMDFLGQERPSLTRIAVKFFRNVAPLNKRIVNDSSHIDSNPQHLLQLFHSSLLPRSRPGQKKEERSAFFLDSLPSVMLLREAGLKFKKRKASSFLDIKFRDGVLLIPLLSIQDYTKSLLLNLVVFEQCYRYCTDHITSYITFMDFLIDSGEDVRILRREGIMENWLGSNDEVADLFNRLGREVLIYDNRFYLSDICWHIDQHYKTPRHVWRASLNHNYFYSPWAAVSLMGAIILFILTLIRTIKAFF